MSRLSDFALSLVFASTALAQPPQPVPQPAQGAAPPAGRASAQPAGRVAAAAHEALRQRAAELTARGARFLLAAQEQDGGWTSQSGPGITCLVLKALIQEPTVGPNHESVRRGIAFVRRFAREDGGIYGAEGLLKNYESSVALSMFAALEASAGRSEPATSEPGRSEPGRSEPEAPARSSDSQQGHQATRRGEPRLRSEIAALQKFLIQNQWDEAEGKSVDDPWYGGAGYGHSKRPDLSNTQMMLDALHDSGLPPDDPTYKKALIFIQRCQMLGETNDQPFAKGSTQGGFIYTAANGGESKAGTIEINGHEELRCYGSMTYAGFKSMLYAGLTHDDPRVRAALDWISRYWTLDYNPNMPQSQSKQGLYYYYHTFGRALAAFGEPVITDCTGREHNWRQEFVAKLADIQHPDGSWTNPADRWMEGSPALTTAYSMLALQAAFAPSAAPAR
jgi:squalene-hopene/tetraprenyl-beta-curcumene cyclase